MDFIHGPHLGDTIYSFPTIRHFGGGDLYLVCPDEENRIRFSGSIEYFESQSYINNCYLIREKSEAGSALDLDLFRDQNLFDQTIVKAHFDAFKISPPITPWLTARKNAEYPVLVHWTDRHRSLPLAAWDFLKDIPQDKLFCVGYPHESQHLIDWGATWVQTKNMMELADTVNSCCVFIGSQSSPLSLAVGLGKARLVERHHEFDNCFFGHENERALGENSDKNARLLEELLGG